MTARLITPPAATPISLAEAKEHLRVTHADEDTLIGALINAAVSHFDGEGELGRAMITQTWAQWVNQAPGYVRLDVTPFQALTAVEYYDTDNALQAATLSDFETWLDGDFVLAKPRKGFTWPNAYSRPDAIKISYTAGFGDASTDVPQAIKHALLLTVAHWYENREAVTEGSFVELPLAVNALIGNQRVGWYG